MTGDPPVLDRTALWAALSDMQLPAPGGGARFEEALAEGQGWPLDFAERVTGEYRRFLYLGATAGFEVTPSQAVDEAWHLHLDCPHYRETLCGQILARTLDHRPATGEPGEQERHRRQYEHTTALYERAFLEPPLPDIWPRPTSAAEEEEDDLEATREQARTLSRRVAFASLAGSLVAVALGAPVVGAVLIGSALIFFLLGQPRAGAAAQDRRSGGCGAGCGGGASGAATDDCAGCGGAGCGGGGCGGGD